MRETSPFPTTEADFSLQSSENEIGLAEALYDNAAEWPDELPFSRGDYLRVLDERPGEAEGLAEGWWLCIDRHGQRGIVPANRLRMMHRFYENLPQKVVTPQRYGDVFMYSNGSGRLPPASYEHRYTPSHFRDQQLIFADEDLDRIFPFSSADRFVNNHRRLGGSSNALADRRMSSENAASPLVRNIPIRIEQSPSPFFADTVAVNRSRITPTAGGGRSGTSGGRISPPLPQTAPSVHLLTPDSAVSTSLSSTASSSSASSSDDDRRRTNNNNSLPPLHVNGRLKHPNSVSFASRPPIAEGGNVVRLRNNDSTNGRNNSLLNGHRKSDYDSLSTVVEKPPAISRTGDRSPVVDVSWRPTRTPGHLYNWLKHGGTKTMGLDDDSSSLLIHPDDETASTARGNSFKERGSGTSSLSDPSSDTVIPGTEITSGNSTPSLQPPALTRTAATPQTAQLSSRPALAPKPLLEQTNKSSMFSKTGQRQQPGQVAVAIVEQQSSRPAIPIKNTSVLQNVLESLTSPRQTSTVSPAGTNPGNDLIARSLVRFDQRSPADVYDSVRPRRAGSTTTPEIARINGGQSTTSSTISTPQSSASGSEIDASWRKHALCTKMSECLRKIEIGAERIAHCTAARSWRQPHILQQHLADIRSAVDSVTEQLDEFVDSTARIAIDRANPLANEFLAIVSPLRDSRLLIRKLKTSLDSGGWTLAALSRQQRPPAGAIASGNDALDQFVSVISQVPKDCRLMFHWLNTQPVTAVTVLVPSTNGLSNGSSSSIANGLQGSTQNRRPLPPASLPIVPLSSTDSTPIPSPRPPIVVPSIVESLANGHNNKNGHPSPPPPPSIALFSNGSANGDAIEPRVIEEDDLESIASDHDSLYQDYAFVGNDENQSNGEPKINTLQRRIQKRNMANAANAAMSETIRGTLSDEDRELLQFYAPQLEQHTQALSTAIDDFLNIIEDQLPPREFVQKGKLIILAAHKLIYIGDNIAQCVSASAVAREVRTAADRLCAVLKECVGATKSAADQYPSIPAVQAMVDSIVTVSHSAHDLKLLVKQCC